MPKPCAGVIEAAMLVCPMLAKSVGNSARRAAVPAIAPQHCTTMYRAARKKLILPAASIPQVTHGFR